MRWLKKLLPAAIPAPWDLWAWWVAYSPAIAAGLTATVGYLQGQPWMWVIMAAALTFAGTAMGLLNLSKWQQTRRVEDKLIFDKVLVGRQPATGEVLLGFQLQSNADFSLRCRVQEVATYIGDRIPRERGTLPKTYDIPPRGCMFYNDHFIKLEESPDGTKQGSIKFRVQFGRGDDLRYTIESTKTVFLGFEKGVLKGGNAIDP